jgi:hypothetical protein
MLHADDRRRVLASNHTQPDQHALTEIAHRVGTCRSKPARRCSSAPFPTGGERGNDEGRRRSVAHHPALGGERIAQQLVRAEEQADLALGGVWPIGAMNDVVTDG